MKGFIPSLKTLLLVSFVFVAGLPILVMRFITGRIISEDAARDVHAKILLIAQSVSAELNIFLEKSFPLLNQIKENVIEKHYVKEDEIAAYADRSLKTNGDLESLEVLDDEGNIRVVALAVVRAIQPDIPVVFASGYDEARVMAADHLDRP